MRTPGACLRVSGNCGGTEVLPRGPFPKWNVLARRWFQLAPLSQLCRWGQVQRCRPADTSEIATVGARPHSDLAIFQKTGVAGPSSTPERDFLQALGALYCPSGM